MNTLAAPVIEFDRALDVVTIDGYKFAREFFACLTDSTPGFRFRILSRADGVITITQERSDIEAAAPQMLGALMKIAENPCLDPEGNAEIARNAIVGLYSPTRAGAS